jgi:hypothetical protein
MSKLLNYLKEKQYFFYEEDDIEEPEDSVEEPEFDYDLNTEVEEEIPIEVEGIPNNSDQVPNTSDFMYSNSEPLTYYARGNGFDLTDNQDFYEVIKLIKDFVDRNVFAKNMTWKADIKNRKLQISFTVGDGSETDEFFFDGLRMYILSKVKARFFDAIEDDIEIINANGTNKMIVTLQKKDENND